MGLFTIVGVFLSALVTVHVLLRKREVAAAIGWIGLAWIAPIIGATFYSLFGINRVARRARKLRIKPSNQLSERNAGNKRVAASLAPALHPLDYAVGQITSLPLRIGASVDPLRNGDEAYPAMLKAIGEAKCSVALSSYIFRDDATGRFFVDALAAAQNRGVEVRVIIDGIGSGYPFPSIKRRLRNAQIPVGRFLHSALPWRMPFLNLRTHKKLLIVDGRIAFTGGINIASDNCIDDAPNDPIRDTHFKICGPIVEQLTLAFASDWELVVGEELDGRRWFPELEYAGPAIARVVTSGPDADLRKIELVILQAITCSRRSIKIITPYFLPSETLSSALSLAAGRGINVDIVIPAQSDHKIVDWATRAHVDPLLEGDVRIWLDELPFDHSKILVVDDAWCFIGSANWDMRSFRLNFELNVEVYDAQLAERLSTFIRTKMTAPLTLDQLRMRALPVRLRDASARLLLPYL
nr:phospholipase D-like domain-containing protein [Methylobacterium iners]